MSKTYKIKPLHWELDCCANHVAPTSFGSYEIERGYDPSTGKETTGEKKWYVFYYFGEDDTDGVHCATLSECKTWAEADWNRRILEHLEEVSV